MTTITAPSAVFRDELCQRREIKLFCPKPAEDVRPHVLTRDQSSVLAGAIVASGRTAVFSLVHEPPQHPHFKIPENR